MKVALDEITGIEGPARAVKLRGVTVTSQSRESGASDEINVIGMTVEEATDRLDKFLDDAALAHKGRIRIIDGHRTRPPPQRLAAFPASHPLLHTHSFQTEAPC